MPMPISGPHTHTLFTVSRTMLMVVAALTPATAFGLWEFGWPAIFLFVTTVVSAWTFEVACLKIAGKPIWPFATDGSAILSGWLVAMTLPPYAPWWVGVIGAFVAIVIAKHLYGGLGQNLFNPAMVARALLVVALPVHMTTWVDPVGLMNGPSFLHGLSITFLGSQEFDAVSSASTLSHIKSQIGAGATMSQIMPQLADLKARMIGLVPGSLGETSTGLLLLGGLMLVLTRIITPTIPIAFLGTLACLAAICSFLAPDRFAPPILHLTSGSTMLCAFFIATDYVTSPVTAAGKWVYGIGIGTLVFVIRTFGAFPEGVAFAVLLMNSVTPLIETYIRPRIFGRSRTGKPLGAGKPAKGAQK
ncbi:RnfABCDGE type electron transport complex subunit D [Rhodobacter capsulatus]|uniref:RnfABCDGE type electron transport complex subunit D n=1 Tax=Rhodobacter capsulatus TaxID=1061 RepID=UPI00402737C8